MKTCLGFMFWGVLLVALDFKFKGFDLLPNFVGGLGYSLIAVGAGGLAPMTGNLVAATALGWLLVVLYIAAPYFPSSEAERFLNVLNAVLGGAVIWTTLAGVGDVAAGRNRPDITRRAVPLRSAYAVLVAISLVLSLTFEGTVETQTLLTGLLLVATLVVMGLILHLLYRAWRGLIR